MERGWYARFLVVLTAAVVGWLALWPSIDAWVPAPAAVKELFKGRINLGLDIQGGLRLMYEVEVDQAIADRRDRIAENLLERLGEKLGVFDREDAPTQEELGRARQRIDIDAVGERRIRVTFAQQGDVAKMDRDFLEEFFPELRVVEEQGRSVTLAIRDDQLEQLRDTAVEQTVRAITNRIDELQIREMTIVGRDTDIIVEVPGASEADFERVRAIISRTAKLEFRVLEDENTTLAGLSDLPEGIEKQTEGVSAGEQRPNVASTYLVARGPDARRKLDQFIATLEVPDQYEVLLGPYDDPDAQQARGDRIDAWRTYWAYKTTTVTGEDVKDAFVTFDPQEGNKPVVALHFNGTGAANFEEMTGRYVKRRMAIVLDNRVESAPVIQTRIGGGRAQITLGWGDFTKLRDEANDLSIVLRAGALPAPIRPANEQLIGPTLGRDSVEQGLEGAAIGVGLVLFFMLIYYWWMGGLVADTMVVLNLLLLLAVLAGFEATLTLPGIAGIALTVGMAVDANVLITERIREELRLGKSPRAAVDQGFRRAFWSIFDGQLTTLIAGVVLFQYGTGPLKGFAVTLMIGIATSLFTGVFCSKVMLDWLVRGLRVQRLKVG